MYIHLWKRKKGQLVQTELYCIFKMSPAFCMQDGDIGTGVDLPQMFESAAGLHHRVGAGAWASPIRFMHEEVFKLEDMVQRVWNNYTEKQECLKDACPVTEESDSPDSVPLDPCLCYMGWRPGWERVCLITSFWPLLLRKRSSPPGGCKWHASQKEKSCQRCVSGHGRISSYLRF